MKMMMGLCAREKLRKSSSHVRRSSSHVRKSSSQYLIRNTANDGIRDTIVASVTLHYVKNLVLKHITIKSNARREQEACKNGNWKDAI